jgi:hypothetical protein
MAPLPDPIWDTHNNIGAQGLNRPFRPGRTLLDRDPPPEILADQNHPQDPTETNTTEQLSSHGMDEVQILALMKSAYRQGKEYQQTILQPLWTGAYNSFNNKHLTDSKYNQVRYRGRSRLFRPKTRSAARKKQAEAAAALFSSAEVIIVDAPNPADEKQAASAAVVKELLTYRLSRSNDHSGIPWFMISMGSHMNAQLTGICASKQYWEYKTKEQPASPQDQPTAQVLPFDPMNSSSMTPPTGAMSAMAPFGASAAPPPPPPKIVRDRPRIRLFPPEDVIRDPAGAWEDQAQDSSYLILRHPMPVADARVFLTNQNPKSVVKFIAIDDAQLKAAAGAGVSDQGTSAAIRRAREHSGNDRYEDQSVDAEYRTVWLHENYMRLAGDDFVFWSLDDTQIISNIVPVEEAYPEQGGARPVTIGVGALEPFKIDPMAPIAAWQPLQQEINDVVNLRLDTIKQTIAPLAIVRRGRSVDIKALQNRSPDSVVYVQDKDDVTFDRPGEASQSSYLEMEKLNADFDEQAGNFSTGSVQTNRALNDTVGGMKIMSGVANAMGEFDLRVWVETWVEPVLRQLVKLEQYYENDQTVITLAANKAQLFQKFNQDQLTDELLNNQVTVICNVGLGASDPMQSVQKMQAAAQTTLGMLGPSIQQRAKQDAIIDEIWGKAGYKDAATRFFNKQAVDDPRIQEAQKVIQQLQGALSASQSEAHNAAAMAKHNGNEADKDRWNKLEIARLSALATLASNEMKLDAQNAQAIMTMTVDAMNQDNQNAHELNVQNQQQAGDMEAQDQQNQADAASQQTQNAHDMASQDQQNQVDASLAAQQNQPPSGTPSQSAPTAAPLPTAQPSPAMPPPAGPMAGPGGYAPPPQLAQLMRPTPPSATMAPQSPQGADLAQVLVALVAQLAQSNQAVIAAIMQQGQQQAAATQQLAQAISAPKRIIRAPDGTAAGVAMMQ